jgi:hypothetical protein
MAADTVALLLYWLYSMFWPTANCDAGVHCQAHVHAVMQHVDKVIQRCGDCINAYVQHVNAKSF